jgi:hypothetical protein
MLELLGKIGECTIPGVALGVPLISVVAAIVVAWPVLDGRSRDRHRVPTVDCDLLLGLCVLFSFWDTDFGDA